MSDPFDDLVREARKNLGDDQAKGVDWDAVDASLFARIAAEQQQERARFRGGRRWPGVVAAAVAAAAVFALAMRDARERPADDVASSAAEASEAGGRIARIEPGAEVLLDGRPAAEGATIRLGDVLEVAHGAAIVERPGKLTMRIEDGSRAAVSHTEGSLVLALARGAVEAQVVPVPSGEAFAVDVDGSRVAVHGTHLRVARSADHVTVDLNEGVVAVGNAPRVGSVIGSLVTAPAHAEFGALDVGRSLAVSHDPSSVRRPVPLGPSARSTEVASQGAPVPQAPVAGPLAPSPAPVAGTAPHAPAFVRPEPHPSTATAPVPAAPPPPAVDPNAEQTLGTAVRACMDPRAQAENVTVVVSTTLHLDLADDGAVRSARFDPPVAPAVNACAAPVIYRTRFAHGGSVAIPISN